MIARRFVKVLVFVAMTTAVILAAGPAQAAASVDGGPVATPAVTPGVTGNPSHAVYVTTTEGPTILSTNSAGDPCATRSFERDLVEAPFGWPEDAWFKMTTYWCWNNVIVTYHNTYETGGVTTFGALEGWSYNGVGSSGWYCYRASGSTRNCSGNTEYAQGSFSACVFKVGCIANWYPFIQEWENYRGGFFHN